MIRHRRKISPFVRMMVLAVVFILFESTLFAQTEKPLTTLPDYIDYAMRHNPELRSADYVKQARVAKIGYAGALPNPVFSYGRFIEPVETRVGPQKQKFGIRQRIPWFGTLGAKKDIARHQVAVANQNFRAVKLQVLYRLKKAFYEYYLLGRKIAITEENIQLLRFWERVIATKYKVGLAGHPDIIKTQIELFLLEDKMENLKNDIHPYKQNLRKELNLPDSIDIPFPTQMSPPSVSITTDSAISLALRNNPSIETALARLHQAQSALRLAGKESFPSFTLGIDYIETGPALNPNLPESGKDPWTVSIGVSLPIWFGKNKAKRLEAQALMNSSRSRQVNAVNITKRKIVDAVSAIADASRKVTLYKEVIIPQTERLLKVSFTSYQSGEIDFLNLLDAQRQLLRTKLMYEETGTRQAIATAKLEMLIGDELPSTTNQSTP